MIRANDNARDPVGRSADQLAADDRRRRLLPAAGGDPRRRSRCTVIDLPRNMLVNIPHLLTDVQVAVLVTELTLAAARDTIRILSLAQDQRAADPGRSSSPTRCSRGAARDQPQGFRRLDRAQDRLHGPVRPEARGAGRQARQDVRRGRQGRARPRRSAISPTLADRDRRRCATSEAGQDGAAARASRCSASSTSSRCWPRRQGAKST